MKTTLDRFGRVAVPKSVRARLGLGAGTLILIEEEGATLSCDRRSTNLPLGARTAF